MRTLLIVLSSLIFVGCTDKMLMPCKTPNVEQAKKGKDELQYINNVFIELEQLREANKVCK